jgi:hypothetical protein
MQGNMICSFVDVSKQKCPSFQGMKDTSCGHEANEDFSATPAFQKAFMVQIPQGQVSAQNPQAMHFLSSEIYS